MRNEPESANKPVLYWSARRPVRHQKDIGKEAIGNMSSAVNLQSIDDNWSVIHRPCFETSVGENSSISCTNAFDPERSAE